VTIATIIVSDITNPTEVQTWLNNHPAATIFEVVKDGTIFNIFYQ